MTYGILNLSFWGYVIAALITTQITIAGVTIYLHRCQAHRALDLHPLVSHFFRLWLWMTTGMVTSEWVAVHRKHHAMTDVEGDPHSPRVEGLKKVLGEGAELYKVAAKDKAMVAKYAHGTPNDWIERNIYSRFSAMGIAILFVVYLILFGLPGITLWAIQMMWIPLHAAGIINGVGHHTGYRNFECADASTNIIPWGFWIGGEELHNNHHTFASSAKFSVKWWEFDIGWFYIRCLSLLGLAKVRKLPPKLLKDKNKLQIDLETVRAVIGSRFQVMSHYYEQVVRPIVKYEKRQNNHSPNKRLLRRAGRLLRLQESLLSTRANARLQVLLASFEQLQTVYRFRQSLQNVWLRTASSQKELVEALQHWCKQAEESGLETLREFSLQIKGYIHKPVITD